jgi:DNA polymerase
MDPILGAATYADFKAALAASNCAKCPALCANRHNIVVDRGRPSPVMVIGEAPGENEDLQGRAFVGRGGQLFDRMMADIGIDTDRDVLIVNVLKCRPPDNRPPTPQEAANCRPFLQWQLDHVKPQVVLLLGATAARHLVPDADKTPMKDRVGRFFELPDRPGTLFQVHYHPAYLLRDPRKKPETAVHLKALRTRLDDLGLLVAPIGANRGRIEG